MAQRELMSNGSPGDEANEEEESLLPNSSRALGRAGSGGVDKGGKGSKEGAGGLPPGSYSYIALVLVVCVITLTVWTLPAPSWWGKFDLMRQSWHLNKVLDEASELRTQLGNSKKDATELSKDIEREEKRATDLKARDVKADSETKSFQVQLVDETAASSGLTGSNSDLQGSVDRERQRRKELLRKLQELKRAQLPLLQAITDAEDGAEKAASSASSASASSSSSSSSSSASSAAALLAASSSASSPTFPSLSSSVSLDPTLGGRAAIGVLPLSGAVSLPGSGGGAGAFGGFDDSSDASSGASLAALAAPAQIRAPPKVPKSSSIPSGSSSSNAVASASSSSGSGVGTASWASAAETELESLKMRLQREVAADRKVSDQAAARAAAISSVSGVGITSSGVRPSPGLPPDFSRIGSASGP